MKRSIYIATLFAAAALCALVFVPQASAGDTGKEAFLTAKCNKCHSVASHDIEATITSEKMKGPDLDGVAAKHDKEWMTKYVKKEEQLDGKSHKNTFKGTDEELQAIIDWLGSLEAK